MAYMLLVSHRHHVLRPRVSECTKVGERNRPFKFFRGISSPSASTGSGIPRNLKGEKLLG